MGAVAVAAAMLAAPTVALAGPEDPALMQFKLPSEEAHHDFEQLGFNMDHSVEPAGGGAILVSAWVTDEEKALAEAHGYPAVRVIHDKYNIDRIRADIAADVKREEATKEALRKAAQSKSKSAVPRTVRAQRADFYENATTRFISIEANTTEAAITCTGANGTGCSYTGPTLRAAWYDAQNNLMGEGNLTTYIDTDTNPDHYQYHYQVFNLGAKGAGPDPAYVRIAAPNGDVDVIAAKEWIAKNPPGYATGFKRGFVTRYYNGPEAYQKMRDLAAEFGNISEAVKLPEQSTGYQRKAQTMLGYQQASYVTFDAGNLPVGSTASLSTANGDRAVVLTSKEYGHLGGNNITAQLVNPGANNAPLSVTVTGNAIRVSLATDAAGAITSTAAQVIAAINANPAASALVLAHTYRTSTGSGVVVPSNVSPLNDLLRAPATVPRGPIDQTMLRIGKTRDGTKVGVFLYCQEHGNEIATSGVCIETAERLLRNYGTDAQTTQLIDNLDIFIVPQINGDGATHSLYDSNRRKNLTNYCTPDRFPGSNSDPAARNGWGVDMNRNFSVGSVFDGFQGATSEQCTSGNYSGPFEFSEREVRNEVWVQTQFPNIKFANNIHSSGNLFMWPPGAYKPVTREPLPYPPYGTLNFFDQAAKHVLDGIKSDRSTAILPQRTGPVIDVLYSAAGNSADNAYYNHGIIGYDFEIGTSQQPAIAEGMAQASEFSAGNYGLLRSALEYANDTAPPVVNALVDSEGKGTYEVRFSSNEASSIYYTLDGSTPTTASTEWKPPRPRALPMPVVANPGQTLKWIATDYKGNVSAVKSTVLGQTQTPGGVSGTVPATLSLTIGQASFGAFVPGVGRTYTAQSVANVISTAGDALLSVSDPSSTNTGKLMNGTFTLAQTLQARVAPTALANVGGAAAPTALKSWTAPTSNEAVTVDFSQTIGANEALRTGTYSKTLTFTLSTTQP